MKNNEENWHMEPEKGGQEDISRENLEKSNSFRFDVHEIWSRFLSAIERKRKERLSIMFIPHNEQSIRNYQISNLSLSILLGILGVVIAVSSILVIYHTSTIQEVDKLITSQKDAKIQFDKMKEEIRKIDEEYSGVRQNVEKLHALMHPNDKTTLYARGGVEAPPAEMPDSQELPVEIFVLNRLIDDMKISEKPLQNLQKYIQRRKKLLDNTPVSFPVSGVIINPYGFIRDASTQKARFNNGIDIVSAPGAEVRATAPGIVSSIVRNSDGTWRLTLQHHYGYQSVYDGLDRVVLEKEEKVSRGEGVGFVGNQTSRIEPVLHYEIIIGAQPQNPAPYLGLLQE